MKSPETGSAPRRGRLRTPIAARTLEASEAGWLGVLRAHPGDVLGLALKGIKPVHEIASTNEIPPVQVSQWKKELQDRTGELFERRNSRSKGADEELRHIERLERKVGQLIVE